MLNSLQEINDMLERHYGRKLLNTWKPGSNEKMEEPGKKHEFTSYNPRDAPPMRSCHLTAHAATDLISG